MLTLFWFVFWVGLSILAFAAGVSLRVRLKEGRAAPRPVVDDQAVRAILETGTLTIEEDEPTDQRQVEEEERRFWSEEWDEPEEW